MWVIERFEQGLQNYYAGKLDDDGFVDWILNKVSVLRSKDGEILVDEFGQPKPDRYTSTNLLVYSRRQLPGPKQRLEVREVAAQSSPEAWLGVIRVMRARLAYLIELKENPPLVRRAEVSDPIKIILGYRRFCEQTKRLDWSDRELHQVFPKAWPAFYSFVTIGAPPKIPLSSLCWEWLQRLAERKPFHR